MRVARRRKWLLLGASGFATAGFALAVGAPDPPPSESEVEHRLRVISHRGDFPLHEVHCVRDRALQRTFVCIVEGPDDTHLAWVVRWLPDGRLAVRRPNGSRVPL